MLLQVGTDFQASSLDAIGRARAAGAGSRTLLERLDSRGIEELALLSTCNRFEIYATTGEREEAASALTDEARALLGGGEANVEIVVRREREAIAHLVAVAAGLESALVGEHEILGQVRRAYLSAAEAGTAGRELARLFEHALRHGRHIRSALGISGLRRSLTAVAADWVATRAPEGGAVAAAVVGAGETGSQMARRLSDLGVARLFVLNRNVAAAHELAATVGAEAQPLARLGALLGDLDVIVLATSSRAPILAESDVRERERNGRRLFVVDLGVPPNAAPGVRRRPSVELLSLSDALALATPNAGDGHGREGVDILVHAAVDDYFSRRRTDAVGPVLRELRAHLERSIVEETEAILASEGHSPLSPDEMRRFALRLSRRLLHAPTEGVREIAVEESPRRAEAVVRKLFFRP